MPLRVAHHAEDLRFYCSMVSLLMQEVAMPKLTKTLVTSRPPGPKDYICWDSDVKSFGVRVYPSGQKSYLITYRTIPGRRGNKRWYTLGAAGVLAPEQARELAR